MLYRSEMTAYARHRIDAAQQALDEHHPDPAGCCAGCGHPGTCPVQAAALQARECYEAWLHPRPVFGTAHRFTAGGRPHVTNAGPY